jgi:hypothetical protein
MKVTNISNQVQTAGVSMMGEEEKKGVGKADNYQQC